MTWLPPFRHSKRMFRVLTAVVTAVSLPTFAAAQTQAKRTKADDKNAPATVSAEQMSGRPDREIVLERDVEIIRGETTINADKATYHIVEDEVEASGNIRVKRDGQHYTGDETRIKIDTGQGFVTNPTYKFDQNNAQGKAERVDFESQDRAVVTDGTYSTCEGPDPDWYLKSDTLRLDTGREIGTATKTIVYFKGVPILGTPAMSFPLSDERKSGFLPPTIGTTNKGGLEVTVPYYFNIAPNRDLTLYPKVIARRGVQLGVQARYLDRNYVGDTLVEVLPNDRQTGTTRYALTSLHTQTLAPALTLNWNLNGASDNDYPSDFSRSITTSAQRLLLRDVNLSYGSTYWNAVARVSNYQVLQDPLAPIGRPYDRLPQINFRAARQDVNNFDMDVDSEFTSFWHPDLVRGQRLVANPKVSYPIIRPGYFVTPKLSLHGTTYNLDNPATNVSTNLTRVLPTFSLDSGLIFERETNLLGQTATQTLEPRLFYVRTPFRDQSQYPIFDTAEADLSFAQIFSENRFVGSDRISDANQLTVALVSRYIESTGAERMRLAVAQRLYFDEQRVTLGAARNESRSDLLGSASVRMSEALSAEGNLQYSANRQTITRANYGMRWQPAPKRVLNLTYRKDQPNQLRQFEVSTQWPLARRWYGVGRINYSLPDKTVAEGLLGVEYKADCWVFRIVAQRIPTATTQATSALFFQLELNGLARLGSNPLEALRTSIPGYQIVNQPSNVNP
jgi:LPS-assembly protein